MDKQQREDRIEELELISSGRTTCDHCHEEKDLTRTLASVSRGVECFDCMAKA